VCSAEFVCRSSDDQKWSKVDNFGIVKQRKEACLPWCTIDDVGGGGHGSGSERVLTLKEKKATGQVKVQLLSDYIFECGANERENKP
jgi:hypothetical protein